MKFACNATARLSDECGRGGGCTDDTSPDEQGGRQCRHYRADDSHFKACIGAFCSAGAAGLLLALDDARQRRSQFCLSPKSLTTDADDVWVWLQSAPDRVYFREIVSTRSPYY